MNVILLTHQLFSLIAKLNIYDRDRTEQVAVPHLRPVAYNIHNNIIMCASKHVFKVLTNS